MEKQLEAFLEQTAQAAAAAESAADAAGSEDERSHSGESDHSGAESGSESESEHSQHSDRQSRSRSKTHSPSPTTAADGKKDETADKGGQRSFCEVVEYLPFIDASAFATLLIHWKQGPYLMRYPYNVVNLNCFLQDIHRKRCYSYVADP